MRVRVALVVYGSVSLVLGSCANQRGELLVDASCDIGDCDASGNALNRISLLQILIDTALIHKTFADSPRERMMPTLWQQKDQQTLEHGHRFETIISINGRDGQSRNFKILGLQHSATRYLTDLMHARFSASNISDADGSSHCGFWKHASLTTMKQKKPQNFEACDKFIAIALMRDPLAWLQSMRTNGWELTSCASHNNFTHEACTFEDLEYVERSGLTDLTFPNLETIWSLWSSDYENLGKFPFQNSLLIRQEDLAEDETGVLRKIAALAETSFDESIDSATLGYNDGNNALDAIFSKSYLGLYSSSELRVVCDELDVELMRRHGYNDCDAALGQS